MAHGAEGVSQLCIPLSSVMRLAHIVGPSPAVYRWIGSVHNAVLVSGCCLYVLHPPPCCVSDAPRCWFCVAGPLCERCLAICPAHRPRGEQVRTSRQRSTTQEGG